MIETSVNEQIAVALDALRLEQARRVTEHLTVGASAGWRDATGVWSQHQWQRQPRSNQLEPQVDERMRDAERPVA